MKNKQYKSKFKFKKLNEAVASKDVDKAMELMISVLSKRLGAKFNIGQTAEFSGSGGDFKGARATFSNGYSLRFNWQGGSGSNSVKSLSFWFSPKVQPDIQMEVPPGASLVKLVDIVYDIFDTKGKNKSYVLEERVLKERGVRLEFEPSTGGKQSQEIAESLNAWKNKMFKNDKEFQKALETQKTNQLYKGNYQFWFSEYTDGNEYRFLSLQTFQNLIKKFREQNNIENIHAYTVKTSKAQSEVRKINKSDEKQFKDELYQLTLDEKFMMLRMKIKRLAQNKIKGLAVTGSAGIGKTSTFMDAMDQENLSYYKVPGTVKNAEAFYELLYTLGGAKKYKDKDGEVKLDNNTKADVILFDDNDRIIKDEGMIQLLMAATSTDGIRQVSFIDPKKLQKTDRLKQVPAQFRMISKLALVTNMPMSKLKKINGGALASRMTPVDFTVTKQEMAMYIKSNIENVKADMYSMKTKNVVFDWIYSEINNIQELDFRFFITCCGIYDDWGASPLWKKEAYDLLQ